MVIPWFNETGSTKHGDSSLNTYPGIERFFGNLNPKRDLEFYLYTGKSLLIDCFLYRGEDTFQRSRTDSGFSFPEAGGIA